MGPEAIDIHTVHITNDNKGLEASPLTGTGLFLDRHDLENFVLEGAAEEVVDNLMFLDRERIKVDLLEFRNLTGLHKTAEFGRGHPGFLLVALVTATTAPTSTTASTTASTTTFTVTTSTTATSSTEATTTALTPPTSLLGRSCVSHLLQRKKGED